MWLLCGWRCWRVASSQLRLRQFKFTGSHTATCEADATSTTCQFLLRDDGKKKDFPFIELNQEIDVHRTSGHLDDGSMSYYAYIEETEEKDFMLSLTDMKAGRYLIGCRVRDNTSQWHYAHASLSVIGSSTSPLEPLQLDSDLNVWTKEHRPGEPLNVHCSTVPHTPITRCSFDMVGNVTKEYFGPGLRDGQCGVHIPSVREEHNGALWCEAGNATHVGQRVIPMVVPNTVTYARFEGCDDDSYQAGRTITCECGISGPKYPYRVTLKLGDEVLTPVPQNKSAEAWKWPWTTHRVTETFKVKLEEEHDGKHLSCITIDKHGNQTQRLTLRVGDW